MPDDASEGLCPQCLLRQAVALDETSSTPTILVGGTQPGLLRSGGALRYFGNYEILEEVGVGGMGVVWRARQASLNRIVALKMIRGGMLANAEEVKRFRAEAQAAANLQHPNIVAIHEIGEQDGQHYYSMDFIQGRSLHAVCDGKPLEPERTAGLLATVAGAVEFAHRAQILHRDLKPHNVMMDAEGVPHLTDFGLAKRMDMDSGMTQTGAIMGSPSYMAPEQAQGRNDAVGPRTDVYSLGAILYETLTGRPPFQAATALDTVRQVVDAEPAPPRSVNPGVPADLETICLKCLEKEPARRYASAQEFADELGRFLRHEPIHARPATRTERVRKWVKRKPAMAALVVVSVAAVLALLGSGWLFYGKLRERLRQSLIEQARSERLVNHRSRSLELIAEAAHMKRDTNLQAEAIQTIAQPGLRPVLKLPLGTVLLKRFSPDGTMLAVGGMVQSFADRTGTRKRTLVLRVWEIPSGRVLGETDWNCNQGWFAWTPDSRRLAVQKSDGTMALWEPRTGGGSLRLPAAGQPVFSPDGARLAVAGRDSLALFAAASGKLIAKRKGIGPVLNFLTPGELLIQWRQGQTLWNPDTGAEKLLTLAEEKIAASSGDGRTQVIEAPDNVAIFRDTFTGMERGRLPLHAKWPELGTALSADGSRFVFPDPSEPGRLRVWDVGTGKFLCGVSEQALHLDHAFEDVSADVTDGSSGKALGHYPNTLQGWPSSVQNFSPDGALLAAASKEGSNPVLVWDSTTGAKLAALPDASLPVWSDDGHWLAVSASGSVKVDEQSGATLVGSEVMIEVWEVSRPTTEQRQLGVVHSIAWSPDSRKISANGSLWDVNESGGRTVMHRLTQTLDVQAIQFGSGRQIWGLSEFQSLRVGGSFQAHQIAPEQKTVEVPKMDSIGSPAISPDGTRLLIGTHKAGVLNEEGSLGIFQFELWDLATGKQAAAWPVRDAHGRWASRPTVFSPDGKLAASAFFVREGIEIRDVATGKQLQHLSHPHPVAKREGELVAFGKDEYAELWVAAIAFTPDSRLVISSSADHALIRDVATSRELADCHASANITSLAISPDGRTLATGDGENIIRLWEIPSGRELTHWQAQNSAVTALAFSPDGKTLASGGMDGVLRLWNLPFIRRELAKLGLDW